MIKTEHVPTPFGDAIQILEAHWYEPDELAKWLTSAHPQLDGMTPIEALADGQADRVLTMVKRLDDGVYL